MQTHPTQPELAEVQPDSPKRTLRFLYLPLTPLAFWIISNAKVTAPRAPARPNKRPLLPQDRNH
ncbi:hypothetical protein [Geothrix sp. 21YS21S-2]|uniref:hypothetical protein n=1 Tax=Geothrix sp. 21YS21S-2 TaxID=3068893 RepID=UPI0027B9BE74|nr:hypothetical protein [Geothrix sp. 21YS21S-2]